MKNKVKTLLESILIEAQEDFDKKIITALGALTVSYSNGGMKGVDALVNAAKGRYTKAIYTGKMYRLIYIDGEIFKNFKSNSEVLQYIKSYKQPKYNVSFSKTMRGIEDFLGMSQSEEKEPIDPSEVAVGVIVSQQGSGLDIKKLLTNYKKLINPLQLKWKIQHNFDNAAEVLEVIAIPNNTIQIAVYTVLGLMPELNDYEDTDGFMPEEFTYPASNFKQVKEHILHNLDGNVISPEKKFHPKDPHAKFDPEGFWKRAYGD